MRVTNEQFHLSQVHLAIKVQNIAKLTSVLTLVISLLLVALQFKVIGIYKRSAMLTSSLVLLYVSKRLADLDSLVSPYDDVSDRQSQQSYQEWLAHSFKPVKDMELVQPVEVLPVPIVNPVSYAPIETALKKPHLMILGETGSGKSTLCKYLVSQVNAPCLIIDPHASPTDWIGFKVIGTGRKYADIATEFERLENLMQSRYEDRDKGITSFQPLIIIIDEFPAIASALGKDATSTVKLLAREARKVQMRLCLLSQGAEVKTLGLEGEGSIRESFAMLRLGNFALNHAKLLKDVAVTEAVSSGDRPAMLDQYPCNLPTLSDTQTLPVLPLPSDYVALLTNTIADTLQPSFEVIDTPSTPVSTSAQPELSAPMQAILDYAQRQNEYVSARKVQSSVRIFRDTTAAEIRSYFQWLSDRGYGVVKGSDESLEFAVNDLE